MSDELLVLLEKLLMTNSPPGAEADVDRLVLDEMSDWAKEYWKDDFGNIIARVPGRSGRPDATVVTAHKDEIGFVVKRVESTGRLRVEPLGGAHAWVYGEGPVDIIGRHTTITGVLSFGARHTSDESAGVFPGKDGHAPEWSQCWIETKRAARELDELGVHVGSRGCVSKLRKKPLLLANYVCGYALDCKAGLSALLLLGRRLYDRRPEDDVFLAVTSHEELGGVGATYLCSEVNARRLIAIEVAPVAPEYDVVNDARPVILYKDARATYDAEMNAALETAASSAGLHVQRAVVSRFGSDASCTFARGGLARSACVGYPTENTHGYEMANLEGIVNVGVLLERYLRAEF